MTPEEIRQIIREELENMLSVDKYTFQQNIQIFDARNIQLGRTNGTKIGTGTDQKLGFYNKTPIVQPGSIAVPTGGSTSDPESRTAIASIINTLKNLGLIA